MLNVWEESIRRIGMASNKALKRIKYALRFLPDRPYIQLYYFVQFKRFCNLKDPKTFNEKLNWLKLHDRNPLYTKLVDKYEAKGYVAQIIGEEYCIPTLGVWNAFDEIDFDSLPNQFVLKCTHDSEGIVIVKDKNSLNLEAARKDLTTALKQNYYYIGREWPYKEVHPRLIAEQYMENPIDKELKDYKFFCFDGEPKLMSITSGRNSDYIYCDYYDIEFNHLNLRKKYMNNPVTIQKPETFDEMIRLANILSKGFPHIRVDFYTVNGKVYFGELTFYSSSGFVPFHPSEWDNIMGDWLKLPLKQ